MNKKNSMPQNTNFIKHSTKEPLTELIELSENYLQQIVGGCGSHTHTTTTTTTTTTVITSNNSAGGSAGGFSGGSASSFSGDSAGGWAGEFIP